jgi:predicted metal-dependent phosphoesterase TrpH
MYVDLHIHTDASDGTWDLDALMTRIIANNITFFSITDHDTIKNSQKMLKNIGSYQEYQGNFIIGAEVSCTYREVTYHLTAYAFDPGNAALQTLLDTNLRILHAYNDATIKALSKMHPGIDYGKYLAYQFDKKKGGWKGLNFLLDEGVIHTISEFFDLLVDVDEKMEFSDPVTVITTIRKAGGFPFLAHPSARRNGERMPEEELKQWIDLGVAGIECYSTYCSLEDAQAYVQFCREHDLYISAGSDCHGTFILERKLAHPPVTLEMVNLPFVRNKSKLLL